MKLSPPELEEVARFFRVFSEPTRLALLQELKAGPRSVGELVAALPTGQANVSKQLRALHEAGLVSRERDGTTIRYALDHPLVLKLCRLACDGLNARPKPRRLRF